MSGPKLTVAVANKRSRSSEPDSAEVNRASKQSGRWIDRIFYCFATVKEAEVHKSPADEDQSRTESQALHTEEETLVEGIRKQSIISIESSYYDSASSSPYTTDADSTYVPTSSPYSATVSDRKYVSTMPAKDYRKASLSHDQFLQAVAELAHQPFALKEARKQDLEDLREELEFQEIALEEAEALNDMYCDQLALMIKNNEKSIAGKDAAIQLLRSDCHAGKEEVKDKEEQLKTLELARTEANTKLRDAMSALKHVADVSKRSQEEVFSIVAAAEEKIVIE